MSRFSVLSFVVACIVSSAAGASFQVQVGENSTLTFNPETIIAQPGDTIKYNFHPKVIFLPHDAQLQL
jgi:plastocyanin